MKWTPNAVPDAVMQRHGGLSGDGTLQWENYRNNVFHITPGSNLTQFRHQANGNSTVSGASASVGIASHLDISGGVLRAFLLDTDAESFGTGAYRSEWLPVSSSRVCVPGTSYLMGVGVKLISWDLGPADQCVLFQVHDTPDAAEVSSGVGKSPPIAVFVDATAFRVVTRYDESSETTSNPIERRVAATAAVSDVWVYFTFRVTFVRTGFGYLEVYINNAIQWSGVIQIGYNDVTGPYPKIGLYRYAPWTTTLRNRTAHYKGCIVVPESQGYTLADIYSGLVAI